MKYTADGSIEIAVDLIKTENKESIKISVKDTGLGIKQEDMKDLFDIFTMTNNFKVTK